MEVIHISLVAIIALLNIIFSVRVLSSRGDNTVNKSFALFASATALWIIIDFLLYQNSLGNIQTFLNRADLAVICLMILALSYFVTVFPRNIFKLSKFVYIPVLLLTLAVILIIVCTDSVVSSAFMEDYGSNFIQGPLFPLFAGFATIFALYSLIILTIKFRRFTGDDRQQIKYVFYGIAALTFFNLLFNLFVPMITKSFALGRFGSYSSILFVGFTAYAILKTRLFNLKIILTESAVVIIDVLMVVQVFTSQTAMEGLLRALFAVLIFYGSYLLLASVRREIKFREELQVMTNQLAHANSHLKELDQMKTEFVSLASHELLTPVSAIEGYLSMLLDEHMAKVEDPKAQKYLANVYSSAKRLARLIADMLNISRIEEGRLLVEKKDINLSELVLQAIDEIHFKADEKKQRIIFENIEIRNPKSETNPKSQISNDQKAVVGGRSSVDEFMTFGDADKIKEVIINLIGNSIKYSKEPGTITVRIEKVPTQWVSEKWQKIEDDIKKRPLDDQEAIHSAVDEHFRNFVGQTQLMIAVKDEGIGIPKEELPRLFKKFHRVGDYTTAESQGTGLGLYISRALVELHHGRIWADSEGPGKGSTFTFTLPDISDKEELLKMEAQAPKKESLKPLARPTKAAEDI